MALLWLIASANSAQAQQPTADRFQWSGLYADSALLFLLDEGEIEGLEQLSGLVFPNAHLFRTAVRLTTGLGVANPEVMDRILSTARRPGSFGLVDPAVQAIAWRGGSCGCGAFEGGADDNEKFFYGIYPFWAAPQSYDSTEQADPVSIQFSQFTRVAYFGLTFDASGRLTDALHWKQGKSVAGGRDFGEFAKVVRQFKSRIDLVVYNSDWTYALPDTTIESSMVAAARFVSALETLREQIVRRIATKSTGLLNWIKPMISLGQSPRRTLGDGVTLDLNFDGLSHDDQVMLLDRFSEARFFERLNADLDQADGDEDALLFKLDLDYALNLIVPVHCIAAFGSSHECGFYSMDNLDSLTDVVDLFLVDMSAQSADQRQDLSGLSLEGRAVRMREGVEHMQGASERAFVNKLVPLTPPGRGRDVVAFFRTVEPLFSGLGAWPIPMEGDFRDSLTAVFSPPATPSHGPAVTTKFKQWFIAPVASVANSVCNWLRPRRFVIFVGPVVIVVLWLAFGRSVSQKRKLAMLVIATLWWNPFFSEHKVWIVVGLLAVAMRGRTRAKWQRSYP